ncbi:AP-like endonuclease reverse transcriptase [Brachionus plicatilis]|uniref:AP-like endonuclease reverse transcriptase n=1 Tax=Brachionus plicatilis TaxID=10195 RepID=A0A3M7PR35_BRAPC|nr:AP-like endonuclease reverse transcriptase [Brachionus plicatilis]
MSKIKTKLDELVVFSTQSNFYLDFKNYKSIAKPSDKRGDSSFDNFSLELLCVKIKLRDCLFFIFSLYNPPNKVLLFELFSKISKKCTKFIIGGDLNSKTKQIGCIGENENGQVLERVLNELNVSVINDKSPTFNIFNRQYFEILDPFLTPSSLLDKITDFKVLDNDDMTSDHYPIRTCLSVEHFTMDIQAQDKLDFKKADWNSLRAILSSNQKQPPSNINELNEFITKNILEAAEKSIPKQSNKSYKSTLPQDIVGVIKLRRKVRRKFKKTQRLLQILT